MNTNFHKIPLKKVSISKLTAKDATKVIELGLCTKELQIDGDSNQFYSEEDLIEEINSTNAICLKACYKKDFVGFIIINYHSYLKELYLSDVVVDKKYRGIGIGNALIESAIKIAKKKKPHWFWVLVQVENKRMQSILENKSFKRGKTFYYYYMEM